MPVAQGPLKTIRGQVESVGRTREDGSCWISVKATWYLMCDGGSHCWEHHNFILAPNVYLEDSGWYQFSYVEVFDSISGTSSYRIIGAEKTSWRVNSK